MTVIFKLRLRAHWHDLAQYPHLRSSHGPVVYSYWFSSPPLSPPFRLEFRLKISRQRACNGCQWPCQGYSSRANGYRDTEVTSNRLIITRVRMASDGEGNEFHTHHCTHSVVFYNIGVLRVGT